MCAVSLVEILVLLSRALLLRKALISYIEIDGRHLFLLCLFPLIR